MTSYLTKAEYEHIRYSNCPPRLKAGEPLRMHKYDHLALPLETLLIMFYYATEDEELDEIEHLSMGIEMYLRR